MLEERTKRKYTKRVNNEDAKNEAEEVNREIKLEENEREAMGTVKKPKFGLEKQNPVGV